MAGSEEAQSCPPPAETLRTFFEDALSGFLITDPSGLILCANQTFAQWMGTEPPDLVGKRFSDCLSVSGKIYIETHLAPLLRMQGAYDEIALELAPAGGPRIPVLVNARERADSAGEPGTVLMVVFKSSERRRYESDLLAARNELRELNAGLAQQVQIEVDRRLSAEGRYNAERETAQLREQFIAVLGHDLRNPLAGLGGGLRLLSSRNPDEKSVSLIALMQASVERMNALVSDLLDFARGRMGGGLNLQKRPVDLEQLLTQLCAELATAHDKVIETQVSLTREVSCDPTRIAQLMSNLIGNAIAHGTESGAIRVICTEDSAMVRFSVTNAGGPIPAELQEKLFQPFIRSSAGHNRRGLGLGLYICAEIARAHHGELKVSSDADETTFTFVMPPG